MSERFVDADGARLWTASSGEGPPVIMCHGGPGMVDYLAPLAALIDDAATVVRYDQRACGLSTGDAERQTVDTATADLDAVRAAYSFEQVVVVGHSWGAAIALAYAAAYPARTAGVAYLCGTGVIEDWKAEHTANAEAALGADVEAWRAVRRAVKDGTATDEQVGAEAYLSMRADVVGEQNARRAAEDLLARGLRYNLAVNRVLNADASARAEDGSLARAAESVRAPVLVIAGEHDPRPWRIGERLAATVPGARFHLLRGAGHLPWYERPDEVRALLRDFIVTASGVRGDA